MLMVARRGHSTAAHPCAQSSFWVFDVGTIDLDWLILTVNGELGGAY